MSNVRSRCYHSDNMHPVRSNKKILSAAITNDDPAPTGVRQTNEDFHSKLGSASVGWARYHTNHPICVLWYLYQPLHCKEKLSELCQKWSNWQLSDTFLNKSRNIFRKHFPAKTVRKLSDIWSDTFLTIFTWKCFLKMFLHLIRNVSDNCQLGHFWHNLDNFLNLQLIVF